MKKPVSEYLKPPKRCFAFELPRESDGRGGYRQLTLRDLESNPDNWAFVLGNKSLPKDWVLKARNASKSCSGYLTLLKNFETPLSVEFHWRNGPGQKKYSYTIALALAEPPPKNLTTLRRRDAQQKAAEPTPAPGAWNAPRPPIGKFHRAVEMTIEALIKVAKLANTVIDLVAIPLKFLWKHAVLKGTSGTLGGRLKASGLVVATVLAILVAPVETAKVIHGTVEGVGRVVQSSATFLRRLMGTQQSQQPRTLAPKPMVSKPPRPEVRRPEVRKLQGNPVKTTVTSNRIPPISKGLSTTDGTCAPAPEIAGFRQRSAGDKTPQAYITPTDRAHGTAIEQAFVI